MRRIAMLALASLTAVVGLASAVPLAAAADAIIPLPLTAFRDVLVDDVHGRVFLIGGGSDGVVVRDLAGAAVTTISDQPGASQLALSDDASTLFVALPNGDGISAIDTVTLQQKTRYPTGTASCPSSVAFAGGKVWFGYGCEQWKGNLGVVDLATDPVTVTTGLLAVDENAPAALRASPSAPGMLLLFGPSTGEGMRVADVSTGSLVLGAKRTDITAVDYAVTADGTHVITAGGYPYYHPSYKLPDLSADGVYGTQNAYPNAVATGAGGLVAAGIDGAYEPDIYMYRADGTLIRNYDFGGCCGQGMSTTLAARGLALTADNSRLYAVTTDYLGGAVTLHVLQDPGKPPSSIALVKPAVANVNKAFSVTGHLTSSTAIPTGRTITVQRDTGAGGPVTQLPSTTTGAGGSFTITDTLTKRGAYGYRATWAGDATHAGTTTRITFAVKGLTPSLSITTGAGPYAYGARPLVVAHLGTTKLRSLKIYAQPYGGTKSLWKSGTVDAKGNLSGYYTITRRTTFTASFAGDDTYEPRYVAKALLAHAHVSSALSGYYATSGSYRLYHRGVSPVQVVTVAPNNAGTCVAFSVQRYYSSAWHTVAGVSCEVLNSSSRAGAYLNTNYPAGTKYRLRGTFMGNSRNVATSGPWQYLRLTT